MTDGLQQDADEPSRRKRVLSPEGWENGVAVWTSAYGPNPLFAPHGETQGMFEDPGLLKTIGYGALEYPPQTQVYALPNHLGYPGSFYPSLQGGALLASLVRGPSLPLDSRSEAAARTQQTQQPAGRVSSGIPTNNLRPPDHHLADNPAPPSGRDQQAQQGGNKVGFGMPTNATGTPHQHPTDTSAPPGPSLQQGTAQQDIYLPAKSTNSVQDDIEALLRGVSGSNEGESYQTAPSLSSGGEDGIDHEFFRELFGED